MSKDFSETKSLQLISYNNQNGLYHLHEQGCNFIRNLPITTKYHIVTIVGKCKTGKSFFLNQLLGQSNCQVSNKLGICTNGIMICTKTIQINSGTIILLDAEGFGNIQKSEINDCKLFILAILLSSTIIYNSFNTIDQQTINGLSMIIQIGKIFQKMLLNHKSIQFPNLFWVIRDFSLKMQNKQGQAIEPKQYLQNALKDQKGNTQQISTKNRIRNIIKTVFQQRQCQTLVLPSQDIIWNEQNLRQQFIINMQKVKNNLLSFVTKKSKKIHKNNINIGNFICTLQQYVQQFNNNRTQMPKIQNISIQLMKIQIHKIISSYKQIVIKQCSSYNLFINQSQQKLNYNHLDTIKIKLQCIYQKFYQQLINIFNDFGSQKNENIVRSIQSSTIDMRTLIEQEIVNIETQINRINSQLQKQEKQTQLIRIKQQQRYFIKQNCNNFSKLKDENELQKQYKFLLKTYKQKYNNKLQNLQIQHSILQIQVNYSRAKILLIKNHSNKLQQQLKNSIFRKKNQKIQQNLQLNSNPEQEIEKSFQKYRQLQMKQINTKCIKINKQEQKNKINKQQCIHEYCSKQNNCQRCRRSFYIPYVIIEKASYLAIQIVKTLVKQNSYHQYNYKQYVLEVILSGKKWLFHRKFKDFSQLNNILNIMFPKINIPNCKITNNKKQINLKIKVPQNSQNKFEIQKNRRQLQHYLYELVQIQFVRNSRIFQKFIKLNKQYLHLI